MVLCGIRSSPDWTPVGLRLPQGHAPRRIQWGRGSAGLAGVQPLRQQWRAGLTAVARRGGDGEKPGQGAVGASTSTGSPLAISPWRRCCPSSHRRSSPGNREEFSKEGGTPEDPTHTVGMAARHASCTQIESKHLLSALLYTRPRLNTPSRHVHSRPTPTLKSPAVHTPMCHLQ